MKQVILVRHGETVDNAAGIIQGWKDTELNDTGRAQMRETATKLQPQPGVVFSSDLSRAMESATIIRDVFGVDDHPYFIDWRLRERSFGTLEDKPKDPEKMDMIFSCGPLEEPFGAESLQAFNDRVWSFIQDLTLIEADTIYVVAHRGVINRFGYILVEDYEQEVHLNASVTKYSIDPTTAINEWEKRKENN
jgi:broad specificity phosphatase PhoE